MERKDPLPTCSFVVKNIGIVNTPWTCRKNMPIQPPGGKGFEGIAVLKEEFKEGLKDVDGFSHVYLIYILDKAEKEKVLVTPYCDTVERGIFSTRSPSRPNRIGMSLVKIKKVEENKLFFDGADILNGTPLIDIKPFIKHFDVVEGEVKSGWMKLKKEEIEGKRSDGRFIG